MTADGVMGRVHGSRRDPRKDEYGKISRGYRRHNWGDCHLEGFWKVLVEILSNLPRPRARRRQYPGSWRADEHFGGGSGELGGDDLARFHGLVLPRSRGFGDDVWQSNVMGLHGIDVWRCPLSPLGRDTHGEPFSLAPEAEHRTGRAPQLYTNNVGSLPNPYFCKAVDYSSFCRESPHPGLRLSVVTMPCKFRSVARHPLGLPSTSVSRLSFDGTSNIDYFTVIARLRWWFQLGMGKILLSPLPSWG
ncbi:hypothetical protein Acr_25g0002600 [Actinidia rufa]|uniref:Uncharacterized protein n=1 Tax=Actinidia rufa TaxID=165716 RepID=A0A7J0GYJ9_9ERIC|nr:hypothetical protein Acr_25g0002600 [Actinidia rufa]